MNLGCEYLLLKLNGPDSPILNLMVWACDPASKSHTHTPLSRKESHFLREVFR